MILVLIIIGIIVALIVVINNNNELKQENFKLRTKLDNLIKFCPECGADLYKEKVIPEMVEKVSLIDNPPEKYNYNKVEAVMPIEKKKDEKEIKNSFILIVGSILIVLAAVLFLTTTWNVVDNMVKTFVLVLMLIIFYGISYIAEHKLNLKQASNTFYYIALAYIPIIFISIAMFSLFGNYLSLFGQGKYIYLTISSLIVSLIYYYNASKKNNNIVFIFNIIFQILSIIFLSLSIKETYNLPILSIIIYSTIINLLYINNKIYFNKTIHKNLNIILTILSTIILLPNIFYTEYITINIISLIINLYNIYIITNKTNNLNKLFKLLYPIYIILIFNTLTLNIESIMTKQIIILLSYILICIYDLYKNKKINIASYITILTTFIIYMFIWILNAIFNTVLLPIYIPLILLSIISIIYWLTTNKYKIFPSITSNIFITLTIISIIYKYNLPVILIGYISLINLIFSMITKDNSLKYPCKFTSLITIFITAFINSTYKPIEILLYLITPIITLIYVLNKKDEVYKISTYIFTNILLFLIMDDIMVTSLNYVLPITTVLFLILEEIKPSLKSIPSKIFLLLQYLIIVIDFNYYSGLTYLIVFISLSLLIIYYILDNKLNINFLAIPFIGLATYIYDTNVLIINNFNYMYIISLILIILLGYLMYSKKNNIFIILYFLFTILHVSTIEIADYFGISLYIIGSTICYLIKENNKVKDTYKGFIYFFILLLGKVILNDLNLSHITVLNYGLNLIFILFLTRTILKKYGNFYKVIEYILTILTNLIAISNYTSELDGLFYVVLLTALVIISYVKKYGPTFITSLIFIVLNVFLLTRELWFNIPWWTYVLALGGILIGFAVNNEARDNKNKKSEKIKELKEYLDM